MDKNLKLQYIQQVLEENLGIEWQDKIVYSQSTKEYRTVNMLLDFKSNKVTYVRLADKNKNGHLAKVKLNNKSFIIAIEGAKIDVSDHWQELLSQQLVSQT